MGRENDPDIQVIESLSTKPTAVKRDLTFFFARDNSSNPVLVPDSPPKKVKAASKKIKKDVKLKTFSDFEVERRNAKKPKQEVVLEAPWPTAETTHVVPTLSAFRPSGSTIPFERRKGKTKPIHDLTCHDQLELKLGVDTNIRLNHARRPAPTLIPVPTELSQRIATSTLTTKDSLWTVTYAPQAASQVLGHQNQENATLLKDWLLELQVRKPTAGTHRRQVTRQVVKPGKRKRGAMDDDPYSDLVDFIVDDNAPDEALYEPDPVSHSDSNGRLKTTFDTLTNLILIHGPHTSGKTCSVYAVAKELDWQVFEVHPGQTRSFKDLVQSVGDVGKNHLVVQQKQNPVFQKAKQAQTDTLEPEISQSLILIEEADVLFADDKSAASFWDGIVHIAANSLRPVVLTCSDISKIPQERLPIQTILRFTPPPLSECIAVLQAVAERQDLTCSLSDLCVLASQSGHDASPCYAGLGVGRFGPMDPPSTISNHPPALLLEHAWERSVPDLRRALLQLQFMRSNLSPPNDEPDSVPAASTPDSVQTKNKILKRAELLSEVDAWMVPSAPWRLLTSETSSTPLEADRELEWHYLSYHEASGLAELQRCDHTCQALSAYLTGTSHDADDDDMQLQASRSALYKDADLVTSILPLSAPLLGSRCLFEDYLPFMVQLVNIDDMKETAYKAAMMLSNPDIMEALQSTNMAARRSRRLNMDLQLYGRHLDLTQEALSAARRLRLTK